MRSLPQRLFGPTGEVSVLSLGGGGIGQVWGATSRKESVATVVEALDHGITLLDLAPGYGDGEAEAVVGEALVGTVPSGIAITTKYRVGNPKPGVARAAIEQSLDASLRRMRVTRVDLMFLHNMIIPDEAVGDLPGTPVSLFRDEVRPAFESLVADGRIGAWGLTGIGVPETLISVLAETPRPGAIQAITNLLDSPGGLKRSPGPASPRAIIAAANRNGVAVMGIRALQAGALTASFDRAIDSTSAEATDFARAAPVRELARELGLSMSTLALRYALSIRGVSTVILGVKNRAELRQSIDAAHAEPLDADLIAQIDRLSVVAQESEGAR